jgi:ABC-2 type transport system ATP-binding protein
LPAVQALVHNPGHPGILSKKIPDPERVQGKIDTMILINNLVKTYNSRPVIDIRHLSIESGVITGLVGNNGAGKTTLFRLLLDLVRASEGEALLQGQDVAMTETWKGFTAAYLDETFLPGYLTPEEYFYFTGRLNRLSKAGVDEALATMSAFFNDGILDSGKYIRDLSKGNQAKVGIAACLLRKPEVLILDEPFANLDPSSQHILVDMLRQLSADSRNAILISSHDLNHITGLCHRILLMERGAIIKDIDTAADTLQELAGYFRTKLAASPAAASSQPGTR